MVLVGLAESYLLKINTAYRALLLFALVMGLSVMLDDIQITESLLANKHNPLNTLLVKWGWGWTFMSVGVFLFSSSWLLHGAALSTHNLKNSLYLLTGTAVWYVFARLIFPYVEQSTGVCQLSEITNKRSCARAGYWWTGFDSSGHCFLLLWNILFIVEEVQVFNSIKLIRDIGAGRRKTSSSATIAPVSSKDRSTDVVDCKLQERVNKWFYLLELQFILISLLTLVWEIMILATAVHFHTAGEKLAGSICGLLSWFLVYRVLDLQRWRHLEIEHLTKKLR